MRALIDMKVVMHADMNSYFASVEQQANPFLRGKPVAICSRVSRNACIIACSVEAKKFGIKTGFNLSEARELCPKILALEVDPPKVRTVTERIFAVFADFTSAIEAYSIDEAFLDLTGHVNDFNEARILALTIKKRIKDEVGEWLRCSVGISHTRWLSKFAGELEKPDGLTILKREDLPRVYSNRPVDEAWGIADGWKARLGGLGIRTLGELLAYNPNELKRRFGMPGYFLWANISGLDIEQVRSSDGSPPKSVGHSYVFHKRTADERQVSGIMMKLCEKVGRRLRRLKLETQRVSVGWGYEEGGDWNASRCFDRIFESYDIFNAAWRAFRDSWDRSIVTSMAITASDLAPTLDQTSIFADRRKRRSIAAAMDAVNDRYGDYTVIRGRMWGTAQSAPDRVGFRKTVEPVWNGDKISATDLE
jgi:DNA polymerase-4